MNCVEIAWIYASSTPAATRPPAISIQATSVDPRYSRQHRSTPDTIERGPFLASPFSFRRKEAAMLKTAPVAGAAALLTGCVAAPPSYAYPYGPYGAYDPYYGYAYGPYY